jgi:hypothetical protein
VNDAKGGYLVNTTCSRIASCKAVKLDATEQNPCRIHFDWAERLPVRLAKAGCQNDTIPNGCELSVWIEIQASPCASIFTASPCASYRKIDYGGDAA